MTSAQVKGKLVALVQELVAAFQSARQLVTDEHVASFMSTADTDSKS